MTKRTVTSRRHRGLAIMGTAVAASAVIAGCSSGPSSGSSPTSGSSAHQATGSTATAINVAINNSSSSLPVVVAEQEGYFTKQGLNAKVTVVPDISKIEPALGHQFDIGFAVEPATLHAYAQGIKVVEVSGNELSTPADPVVELYARANEHITSPSQLKGKTIGGPTLTGTLNLATLQWLKMHGVPSTSIKEVQVTDPLELDELKGGQIDVAELQPPYTTQAKSEGYTNVGYPLSVVGDPAPMAFWASTESWAKSHLSTISKFKAAIGEADSFIVSQKSQAQAIDAKFTKEPLSVAQKAPIPEFTTVAKASDMSSWANILRSVQGFNPKLDYQSMVVTSK